MARRNAGVPAARAWLWEVRSSLPGNRIARVIFSIVRGRMVLLHGFIKKRQRISEEDLSLALRRLREIQS